jgi:hypothetical protein
LPIRFFGDFLCTPKRAVATDHEENAHLQVRETVPDRSHGDRRISSGRRMPRGSVRSATDGDGRRQCLCWTNGDFGRILCDSWPILLSFLLPLMARGANLKIDRFKIVTTLLMTQILPLGIGMLVHSRLRKHAEKLQKPANLLSAILSLVVFVFIISLQYRILAEIRWLAFVWLTLLILLCLAAGWIVGAMIGIRRAVGLTTAGRNVGVALVIATASFPDSAAVTAAIVVAMFQTLLLALVALWMGRFSSLPQPA